MTLRESLMNNIHSISEQRKLKQDLQNIEEGRLDAAADWIAKFDRGLSKSEKKTFQKWLSLTPKNTEILLEVAHLWDKINVLDRLADLFPSPSINKKTRSNIWVGTIAASIMMIFTSSIFIGSTFKSTGGQKQLAIESNFQKSYHTDIGESKILNLPDGSKIVLNTNTSAEIRYTPIARIIELKQGEINIDVAHNKLRPLSVIVAGKVIQAVGTAFNVEVRDDSIELIVTDGKVLVAPIQNNLDLAGELENISIEIVDSSVAISKGEKINLLISGEKEGTLIEEKVVKVAPVEIAASLSWRTGNLIFRGESLAETMAEISRYSDVKFELDDDVDLRKIRVAGMFRTGDITGLLNVLEQNFKIKYEQINQQKIFLRLARSN